MEELPRLKCNQCGHTWIPRVLKPKKCPRQSCQSEYWNEPKREKRARVQINKSETKVKTKNEI